MSPEFFALAHLFIVVAVLAALVAVDRFWRVSTVRSHRGTRFRQITTEEVMEMIRKATRS